MLMLSYLASLVIFDSQQLVSSLLDNSEVLYHILITDTCLCSQHVVYGTSVTVNLIEQWIDPYNMTWKIWLGCLKLRDLSKVNVDIVSA